MEDPTAAVFDLKASALDVLCQHAAIASKKTTVEHKIFLCGPDPKMAYSRQENLLRAVGFMVVLQSIRPQKD